MSESKHHIGKTCGQCIHFKNCNEEWNQIAGEKEKACPDFEEFIRVLAVRPPFAQAIMQPKTKDQGGRVMPLKDTELRTRITQIRGPVGIYVSKKTPTIHEKDPLLGLYYRLHKLGFISTEEYNFLRDSITPPNAPPSGHIIGTVEILDCLPHSLCPEYLENTVDHHLAPISLLPEGKPVYGWILRNPKPFKNPVKINWPSGGPWARIPKSKLPELK